MTENLSCFGFCSCCRCWLLVVSLFIYVAWAKVVSFDQSTNVYQNKKLINELPRQTLNPKGQCSTELWKLNRRLQQIVHPLELEGHWVSTRCEIHAGPKFVMRDYQFHKTGNFLIRHYEYYDEYCTRPMFGFTVDGNMVHLSKSWAVPGASEGSFTITKVTVVPYTKEAAKSLTVSLRQTCTVEKDRPFDWPWLVEYKDYILYFFENENDDVNGRNDVNVNDAVHDGDDYFTKPADLDCMHSANFTVNTLNLFRMDEIGDDAETKTNKDFFVKRLYFGKTVWDAKNRTYLLPSSFTDHLVDADQAINCKVCDRIKNSHPLSPPKLRFNKDGDENNVIEQTYQPASDYLKGDWLSTSCESFMHGMYGYRLMSFKEGRSRRWKLRQRYFNDPLCKHPSFTLLAKGHYSTGPSFRSLSSTQKILYKIQRVKLVPESLNFVRNIKLARQCGPSAGWRKGRTVDVTTFGGCVDLGISVPSITRDIVKVSFDETSRKLLLHTGDYTTVEFGGQSYPTCFQSSLIKCDEFAIKLSLQTSPNDDLKSNYLHLKLPPLANGMKRRDVSISLFSLIMILLFYLYVV